MTPRTPHDATRLNSSTSVDKYLPSSSPSPPHSPILPELETGDMIVREKLNTQATEFIPTTRARRWWLRITWFFTWWIPSFLLVKLGKMKRQDIRMAWREKVAIFMMIFGLCGIVIFYIVIFGRLLCPDSDKAWNTSELATHAGDNDYYAAIAGKVYDVSVWVGKD
jgi:chitin synthase